MNEASARYCSSCGAALPPAPAVHDQTERMSAVEGRADADADVRRHLETLPAGAALLAVRRGPNAGRHFVLGADRLSVGRHPRSDLFLDDVTVSRRHAVLEREGDRFRVRDVGSLNGTYVNHERVEDALLVDGDELQVGRFVLTFHEPPAGQP